MFYCAIPLAIGVILLTLFLFFRVKEKRITAVIFKGLTSFMFIATALVAWLTSSNPQTIFGLFVVIGLFFGLLGDVFLDIKYIDTNRDSLWTSLGFLAFGFGHIFFITGLLLNYFNFSMNVLYLIIPVVIAIALTVVALLMEKFTPIKYGNMKSHATLYGFVLFFVTAIYWSATIQTNFQNITLLVMSLGFILFALSDLILNNTYFAPGFNTPAFIISNHIFYYVAQFAIAASLMFLL